MFRIRHYDDYDEAVLEWRRLGLPRDFIDRRRMLGTVFAYADGIEAAEALRLQRIVKAQGAEGLICQKLGGRTLLIAAPPSFFEKMSIEPGELGATAEQMSAALRNFSARHTLPWKLPGRDLRLDRTMVMGILNMTPDSFHDGGAHGKGALEHALRMVEEGADIIDIGGESTRPGAVPVTPEAEMARVLPVLEGLAAQTEVPISIDTRHWQVAEAAAAAGASIVNDIGGLRDPSMRKVVAERHLGAVVMHMRGTPANMQADTRYLDLVGEVFTYLRGQVEMAVQDGIAPSSLVLDPGLGFSKSPEGNLELLRRLREFRSLGLPTLIGASHKAFIGKVQGDMDASRLEGSLAAATIAAQSGASIIRAHDVRETRAAVRMADAVAGRISL
jgi:dihydropteroate synthase